MKLEKPVNERTPYIVNVDYNTLPKHESDSMCRILVNCINRYFEDPEVQEEYQQWKQKRQQPA